MPTATWLSATLASPEAWISRPRSCSRSMCRRDGTAPQSCSVTWRTTTRRSMCGLWVAYSRKCSVGSPSSAASHRSTSWRPLCPSSVSLVRTSWRRSPTSPSGKPSTAAPSASPTHSAPTSLGTPTRWPSTSCSACSSLTHGTGVPSTRPWSTSTLLICTARWRNHSATHPLISISKSKRTQAWIFHKPTSKCSCSVRCRSFSAKMASGDVLAHRCFHARPLKSSRPLSAVAISPRASRRAAPSDQLCTFTLSPTPSCPRHAHMSKTCRGTPMRVLRLTFRAGKPRTWCAKVR
mmetsp:Transcript_29070/g.84883  ORF Transcript_29070/g.84883 Transcript_29070/m.84883 type:complete len:293 (+) Transcript_29070:652-1530(+)